MAEQQLDPAEPLVPAAEAAGDATPEGGRPRAVLAADEALERLRRGATLENVRVENLRFKGDFPQGVRLKNCHLVRPRFDGATFGGKAVFQHCTLERPHFSHQSVFAQDLVLAHATVVGAQVTKVTVRGIFNCEGLRARGSFDVFHSHFEGPVRFWDAEFAGWANFKNCEFASDVDFRSFRAQQGFVVRQCKFASAVLFRGASVALKLDLTGSRFEGMLDLSRAKLNDYVYLEEIEQGERQQFAFANTLGERVLVRPHQLYDRLASELVGDYAGAMHEYAFLKRAYGALHRYEMEDWAFYRFKVNQRRSCPRSWTRPWTKLAQACDWLFLDLGCGYCTSPSRAVRSALLIMLGFGLVYMAGVEQLNTEQAKLPFDEPVTSPANRVMVGLLTSVSVFTSGIGGIREMARGWMNVPLLVESLLGTLLWGLFIVAFSRKVIR
jgi:hypothetical protein